MQITNVNIYPNNIYQNKANTSRKPLLTLLSQSKKDVISFSGQLDLLKLSENEILEKIKTSIADNKNYLGEGGDAIVYKIPDTDYCVRLNKDTFENYKFHLNFKLNERDKVNHVVAKLGHGSSIMKYIEGSPVFTPFMRDKKAKEIASIIEQMPTQAYKKLFYQICDAHKLGMMFDCSWPNVIINSKNNTMTAIDFYKSEESINPLRYIYSALVTEHTTLKQRQNCAGKLFAIALDEFKPGKKPHIAPMDFDFYRFIYSLGGENCTMQVIENPKYIKLLVSNFEKLETLKYSEIRNIDVKSQLNASLKVLKSLIKQLFGIIVK